MGLERYRKFYEMYLGPLPEASVDGEIQVSSCFRHDPNPSMFINLQDGRYNDFGSDFKGDAYNFYMHQHNASFATAKKAVDAITGNVEGGDFRVPLPIPEEKIEGWHQNLLRNDNLRTWLVDKRGISLEVLKRHKIGHDGERYTIPVYNKYDVCVNVRRYSPGASGDDKMLNYAKGYGAVRLMPLSALESNIVFLLEGEWDTFLHETMGFKAITQTAGAGTWRTDWNNLFKGKIVYIVYDCDDAGRKGAKKVATQLMGVAEKVHIIGLPLKGTPDDKDITDYYIKNGKTAEDFMELVSATPVFQLSESEAIHEGKAVRVSLNDALKSKYKHSLVEFDVMVVGKDTAPYNIPSKMKFVCSMVGVNERMCGQCQIGRAGGEVELEVSKDPEVLDLIKTSKSQQMQLLKRKAGIPQNCSLYQLDHIHSVNLEEILIAPEIQTFSEWDGGERNYHIQTAFFIDQPIEANRSYRMKGVMTPDPWQQHVTFLLTEAEPLQDTVAAFRMTDEIKKKLEIFQTTDVEAKFKEIHRDFEDNITHIIGRSDLLTGIDLVYHSVLGFYFQDVPVQKGWLEFLCIGDTRTGKSETMGKMLEHYGLGEMSVAENTSFAGLVGGLQQTGDKRWFLTWGKIPLNDGRLFVIDEASGLEQEDIAKMSGIRSSGVAEVTKIHTEKTQARTRLIWLSNPRNGQALSTFSYGVQAIQYLIGKAEDISRFDFLITASRDEVPIDEINKRIDPKAKVAHKYTSELCKLLVLWAWSRKPEDIIFSEEAIDLCLKYAIVQGREYSSKIPLVEGANQRIKIAKLAVASACRVFSTDETGEKVIVNAEHVEFAYNFLEEIYRKPSLDYRGYSDRDLEDKRIAEEHRDEIMGYLNAYPMIGDLFDRQEYVWPKHFEEQIGQARETISEHIARFSGARMIYDANGKGYKKTPAFIQLLREWKVQRKRDEEV